MINSVQDFFFPVGAKFGRNLCVIFTFAGRTRQSEMEDTELAVQSKTLTESRQL